jgi:hypothetical protein
MVNAESIHHSDSEFHSVKKQNVCHTENPETGFGLGKPMRFGTYAESP